MITSMHEKKKTLKKINKDMTKKKTIKKVDLNIKKDKNKTKKTIRHIKQIRNLCLKNKIIKQQLA